MSTRLLVSALSRISRSLSLGVIHAPILTGAAEVMIDAEACIVFAEQHSPSGTAETLSMSTSSSV